MFTYYGTTTNAPNTGVEETKYWSAGGGTNLFFDAEMADRWTIWFENGYGDYTPPVYFHADGDPPPPVTATNLTFTTQIEFYSLYYQPVALATNPVDHVLYESGVGGGGGVPGDYETVSNRAMSAFFIEKYSDFRGHGMGTLLDWGYKYDLGIPWDAWNVKWLLPYDADEEAEWADSNTKIVNIASTNYVDRALARIQPPAPSAPEVTTALRWRADGTACIVTVAAGGTLTADTSNWTEGQAVMAIITLADGAGVASGIELVGYGAWPTGTPFVACCYRIGLTVFVVPSTTL